MSKLSKDENVSMDVIEKICTVLNCDVGDIMEFVPGKKKGSRRYNIMDHSYPYIASLTREPFLFYEMRSTAKLMAEGNSDDAIVKRNCRTKSFPVSNGKIYHTHGESLYQTASCTGR